MTNLTMDARDVKRRIWPLYPLQLVELVARDVARDLTCSVNNQNNNKAQDHASSLEMALEQARVLLDMGITPDVYGSTAAFRRPRPFYPGSTGVPRIPGALVDITNPDVARHTRDALRRERRRSRAYAQKMRSLAISKKPRHASEFKGNGIRYGMSASLGIRIEMALDVSLISRRVAGETSLAGDSSRHSRLGLARSSDPIAAVRSHNVQKRQRTASKHLPSALNHQSKPTHPSIQTAHKLYPSGQSLSKATSNLHPSRVPLSLTPDRPSVVFQSQILPPSFSQVKRFQIRQIFLLDAPYIPTCIVKAPGHSPRSFFGNLWDNSDLLSKRVFQKQESLATPHRPAKAMSLVTGPQRWPRGCIPMEIYSRITEYLPRDSIENMRLVCKEFEVNVSAMLFQSVVVPFRSEIYGMINASRLSGYQDTKGEGKADEPNGASPAIGDAPFGIYDQKVEAGSIHKGMAVFKGWGPRIRKFAMVFEADGGKLFSVTLP